ncbi:hypothetical protein ACFSO7_01435 [Bacillus sp. CGMCC 1.16607]|uniref:hypothetical protein n=1 Tax=Bacillus sp. CGMCC 1.16607 TaxID=3351842 RepID=UPI003625E46B
MTRNGLEKLSEADTSYNLFFEQKEIYEKAKKIFRRREFNRGGTTLIVPFQPFTLGNHCGLVSTFF